MLSDLGQDGFGTLPQPKPGGRIGQDAVIAGQAVLSLGKPLETDSDLDQQRFSDVLTCHSPYPATSAIRVLPERCSHGFVAVQTVRDQCVPPVAARDPPVRVRCCGGRGRDPPAAVVRVAQQRGKARPRVEARPAQPVDGAVLGDDGGRLAVTDEGVILDAARPERAQVTASPPRGTPGTPRPKPPHTTTSPPRAAPHPSAGTGRETRTQPGSHQGSAPTPASRTGTTAWSET